MNQYRNAKFSIGLALSLSLFLASSLFSYKSIRELVQNSYRVDHTNAKLLHLESIISYLKDAETANRGYALTHDSIFLEPYLGSYAKVEQTYSQLRKMTKDNISQQRRLDILSSLVEERYENIRQQISLLNESNLVGTQRHKALLRQGKAVMDHLRKLVDTMIREEQALLALHAQRVAYSSQMAPLLIFLTFVLATSILLAASYIIHQDNKELLEGQRLLKENEEKFKSLLESAPDAMIITNEQGLIELANVQTYTLFGYQENELVGKPVEQLIPDRYRSTHTRQVSHYGKAPKTRAMGHGLELYGKRKDGSEFAVEVSLSPLKTKQGMLFSAAIRDITERKKVQVELQKAKEKAERATAFKSRFIADISHEIRTPINAILGFAGVLRKQIMHKEELEYLEYITSSGDLLLRLIGDILDLSKIEEGKQVLVKEPFHLQTMLLAALLPYKARAQERGVEFIIAIDSKIPTYLMGDGPKLIQIIVNLVGNALKFTSDGFIKVDCSLVDLNQRAQQATLRISISDTGIGITSHKQSTIFDSYTQADSTIAKNYGGSGLGLSIVKELVKLLGSEIDLISPANHSFHSGGPGSIFTFDLTVGVVAQESVGLPTLAQEEPISFNQLIKVLVVEDNLINQKLAKIILENKGCQVDLAGNGKEAILALKQHKYNIILMDVQMPLMDGLEATRLIRERYSNHIPIIGLTANVYKEDVEKCLTAGMNDFLSKPYSEYGLLFKIKQWTSLQVPPQKEAPAKEENMNFLEGIAKGDKHFIKEIWRIFLNQGEEFTTNLNFWVIQENYTAICGAAHKLLSTARVLDLASLAETLHEIEKLTKEHQQIDYLPILISKAKKNIETASKRFIIEMENRQE